MNINRLLTFLSRIFGEYKAQNNSEYVFRCPLCNAGDSKKKLSINLDATTKNGKTLFGQWHCWRNPDHKGSSLYKLLTATNKISYIADLKELLKDVPNSWSSTTASTKQFKSDYISLPQESKFILDEPMSIMQKSAIGYLVGRGFDTIDFLRYNVHYGYAGDYFGYIIFPSYNKFFKLNYYTARSFTGSSVKHILPELPKNIIFNEHLINWNEPIILCEGVPDAVAIGDNAIPILGNSISQALFDKITIVGAVVYIALDNDMYEVLISTIKKLLKNNITIYYVKLDIKDPSLIGKEGMKEFIKNAELITHKQFLQMQM